MENIATVIKKILLKIFSNCLTNEKLRNTNTKSFC